MNWGGFAGGFSQGFGSGVKIGNTIKDAMKQKKIEDIRAKGIAEATGAYDSHVAGMVRENGLPKPAGNAPSSAPGATVPNNDVAQSAPVQDQAVESVPLNPLSAGGGEVSQEKADQARSEPAMRAITTGKPLPAGPITHDGMPARQNADGTHSTELSITVTDPRINGGKPTNIPSLWGGKEVSQEQAIAKALDSGNSYQAYDSIDEAVAAAKSRSNDGGAAAMPSARDVVKQTGVGASKRFSVGEKSFDTREEALAYAKKIGPNKIDFIVKSMGPKMQEFYIAEGDVAKAEAWEKYINDRKGRRALEEWAGAVRSVQLGNVEKAADHVFNLYKTYDDGITPLSKEVVKDKSGNITGFNVRLKDDESGEERTQFIDQKTLTEMGLAALAPPQMFEAMWKRQQEADQAAAAQRAEIAKENRAEARDNRKAARDQDNAIERLTITEQMRRAGAGEAKRQEVMTKVDMLRRAGYSEEFIDGALPSIIGIGDYKKKTSPEEARRMLHTERLKDTYGYARKSPEEQSALLDNDMRMIYGEGGGASPRPAAAGLPQQGGATTKPGGVPVYDTKTGQIIYR